MEQEIKAMIEIQSEIQFQSPKERGPVAMQLKDVAVSFHGRTAVRDCTFDVTKNKVTSLIGPSGSGKTTLLRALNRLHDLTPGAKVSGKIMLEGTDVYRGNLTVTELRTRVGMVFQRPNPFPTMSIYDNVSLRTSFQRHQEKVFARRVSGNVVALGRPLGLGVESSEGGGVESLRR